MNKTAVIPNKHLQITALPPPFRPMPVFSAMLSRPEFCTKLPPVVKMPLREKIGNRSNDVNIFYVNLSHPFHSPPSLWKTLVDNHVENVEKY